MKKTKEHSSFFFRSLFDMKEENGVHQDSVKWIRLLFSDNAGLRRCRY